MTREEFQKEVSERFQNTDSGFGNMTQRELILLQIASNVYDGLVKNCSIPYVGKRIFIVFAQRKDPLNEAREIIKVFTKESEAVIWIADNNPKKYYYEVHKVG